jgi:broad specificity phosphatase PhoE
VKFVLVCHGQTQPANANGEDPGLSALGLSQARAIARETASVAELQRSPDAFFSSPRPAAVETVRQIAAEFGAAKTEAAGELDDGAVESGAAGGQDLKFVQGRAWAMLESLKERSEQDATIVLVSNLAVVRALISRALNMPAGDMWRFALDPASITTIEFRGQRTLIGSLNEVCHLGSNK